MGHQNLAHVRKFLQNNGIDFIDENFGCDGCASGKQHRLSFSLREEKSTACGEIIHADVCGPMEVNSLGGKRYFVMFKDDFSHFRFVFFLKNKSEVVEYTKFVIKLSEKQFGHPVKILRTDNGTEIVNESVTELLHQHGIRHQRTVSYTPEQNGCAERENRTIMESARSMIYANNLDLNLWAEAVHSAVFILNRTGTSTIKDKTPYELWYGKRATFNRFRIFGSEVYVHIPKQRRRKLDAKSKKCVFVGYDDDTKGFRVVDENKVVSIVRDVKFLMEEPTTVIIIDEFEQNRDKPDIKERESEGNEGELDATEGDRVAVLNFMTPKPGKIKNRRTSTMGGIEASNVLGSRLRARSTSTDHGLFAMLASAFCEDDEPKTYEQAMNSSGSEQWSHAMDEEFKSLVDNETWDLVEKPIDQRVVDCKWVYKIKRNPDESINRFKARLVAKGFTQQYGIDYEETFSPVVRFTSVRAILAIAAEKKLLIKQFDVKTAFLNGELSETVYINQPNGYNDGTDKVYRLNKALYGLKQASRCWNQKFTNFIEEFGFNMCDSDSCVFVSNMNGHLMILAIYVDDGLVFADSQECIDKLIEHLQAKFEIKIMDVGCFLGMQIRVETDGSIFINQEACASKVLRKFRMENCRTVVVPSDPNQVLSNFEEADPSDFPYRQLIGSLMYLAVATRPDISFAVGNASRYMENPKQMHVDAAKRILIHIGFRFFIWRYY